MSEPRTFSVSELIRQINLDLYRYNDIAVEGEVSNYIRSAAGHLYFTLKDARAQIRVVFFATHARFLRFRIENGLQLIVRGRLSIYEAKGEFQLNATAAEPASPCFKRVFFESGSPAQASPHERNARGAIVDRTGRTGKCAPITSPRLTRTPHSANSIPIR